MITVRYLEYNLHILILTFVYVIRENVGNSLKRLEYDFHITSLTSAWIVST